MYNEQKSQRIEKDGCKFVCRNGLEDRKPQEEEKENQ